VSIRRCFILRPATMGSAFRGRSSFGRPQSPARKTCQRFWVSICRDRSWLVGEGPQLESLRRQFPAAHFPAAVEAWRARPALCLGRCFRLSQPHRYFGLVLLEALASAPPVGAFPVRGPLDVIGDSERGCARPGSRRAALRALDISRAECRRHALEFTWAECAQQFIDPAQPRPLGRARSPLSLSQRIRVYTRRYPDPRKRKASSPSPRNVVGVCMLKACSSPCVWQAHFHLLM